MSRLAAIAQQLQQTAQMREQLDMQKQELQESMEAGVVAILAIVVQETKNTPTSDLRVWVEPEEACRGQASFDTSLKQEVVFQLVSNEGKICFAHPEEGSKAELGIEELPDGQIFMAWLKPDALDNKEDNEAEGEAAEGDDAAKDETPSFQIRAEYDTVQQKLMTLERKLQQAEDNQTALQQQLKQFQSASTAAPPTVEDADDLEEEEEKATEQQVTTKPAASHQRQRSRAERAAPAEESKTALQTTLEYAALAGGVLYQHSAVFIFIGSAVAMHLYGDYASV